ncbi:GyrI-like domain-containing protein [Brevibacterium sp. GP-SGM9]|uniref:GyrI-like domain-containing protein n=1 Tax=Brevibacterium sp. GP-SGM9 TaxID=3376990 RepID=UPI0039A6A16B
MDKIDPKKSMLGYRAKRGEFETLELPARQYLMIDGHGDPNSSPEFTSAVESLYPLAYGLKFLSKRELERDYVVPPLEALWWADDMSAFTTAREKSSWDYTLMLLVPDWLSGDDVDRVTDTLREKKRAQAQTTTPRLGEIRLEQLREGTCIQTLHIGPFDAEAEVLARLHDEVVPQSGFELAGKHHEIYLSDFRRVAPERLRTILRQPVVRVEGG